MSRARGAVPDLPPRPPADAPRASSGGRLVRRALASSIRSARSVGRWARRRPLTAGLAVLLLLVTVGGGAGYTYIRHQWRAAQADVRELRLDDARRRLERCLAVWPRRVEVRLLAARAARLAGDFEAAEAHLNECLRLSGGATEDVQLEFLLIRAQTGEIEEVAPLLEPFVENGHRDASLVLETMARVYMHHLEYGPAFRCLSRWTVLSPEDARPHYWRGWVFERVANPARAREDYERALALDPDLFSVRLRLAEMLLEDRQPQDAVGHLEYLSARHPDRPEVRARLGQCRFLQGHHPEARRLLEEAVAHLPDDRSALLHLARLDLQDGQPARAEERLRRVLAADPADTEARHALVTALKFQRRDREAADALAAHERDKALVDRANKLLQEEARHSSRDPKVAAEIGTVLLQIGQERQGVFWLNQALTRDPDHQPAHKALAEHYEKKGDREQAAAHRRRVQ